MKPCPVCQEPCENKDELYLHLLREHCWSIERVVRELGEMMMGKTHTARILGG